MEYITAFEAAENWAVSLRQVQRLAAAGRIPGARKHARDYLIPTDAEKPGDPRYEKKDDSLSQKIANTNAAIHLYAPLDNPYAIIGVCRDERARVIPDILLSYQRGDFYRVKRLFQEIERCGDNGDNMAVKILTSGTAIAAAVSLGDEPFFLQIETWLKDVVRAAISPDVTSLAEYGLSIAYTGMVIHEKIPEWLKTGDFRALPNITKPFAACTRVQYLSQLNKPEAMLMVAQTYLSLCGAENVIYEPDTNLRIYCAEACMALGREDEAKYYLRSAMKKVLPRGLISAFAERIHPLNGLCETLLKQEFPAYYDAVVGQCERSTWNWVIFHNRYTKDNITLTLSLRDYHMARQVALGVPYKKIAAQFNLTYGSFNNRMQIIYQKLNISGKKELIELIL